jgi:hypothetical protein
MVITDSIKVKQFCAMNAYDDDYRPAPVSGKEKYLARDRVFWYSLDSLIVQHVSASARSVLEQVFHAPVRTSINRVGKIG